MVEKFLELQMQVDHYDKLGAFESLRTFEEDIDKLARDKRQAEINLELTRENANKEKQDFDKITALDLKSFFKDKKSRDDAISKEEVYPMNSSFT